MPTFWLALMAVLLLSYLIPVFPASHMHSPSADRLSAAGRLFDLLYHLALPALVLGTAAAAGTARFVRNSLLDVLGQDYIRTARAKGLSEPRVLLVHALRNALAPLLQLLGLSLPLLLNGSLVVEVIFAWPGLGRVTFQAIAARDYPVVLATTALSGVLVVAGNLLADLLHVAADPRLRRG
jgi:peptide/nickel transport system permease protein